MRQGHVSAAAALGPRLQEATLDGDGDRLRLLTPPRTRTRDVTADFDAFVVARGAAMVRTAWALLKNPDDAEDVVQDVLVKAHVNWARIQRAGNPDAYVRRMLVNACTSFWRRGARREQAVDTDVLAARMHELQVTADSAAAGAERDLMLALLRRLPTKQRAVLVLRHYDDLDDASIADALGMSAVAVRGNAHRGLIRLRALLAEHSAPGGTR